MPKVSVIMNCLNGERYLKEAIDSVYAQAFSDWEIVFWDNASTDRTAQIANSYDKRLRYFRADKTVPLGPARNLALAQASGEWIAFLDHDDVNFPTRLERQISAIGSAAYVLCSGGIRYTDQFGKKIRDVLPLTRTGDIFEAHLRHSDLWLQSTMVHAPTLKKHGIGFNENCKASEDTNLFLRVLAKGAACIVPEIVSTCRIVPSSLTDLTVDRHAVERAMTLEQLIAENPGIEQRYAAAFRIARAKVHYYRAKYLMDQGDVAGARSELAIASPVSLVYAVLRQVSRWPFLWRVLHDRKIKARLWWIIPAFRG